jgi:arylsulfatase A-like enzyme
LAAQAEARRSVAVAPKKKNEDRKMKRQLLLLIALSIWLVPPLRAAEKPNVLLLIVDDLNTLLLGDTSRYAGKVVSPNLTRLAESGVNFTRNYAASPKCSPSRTAFLSGVAPWKSGVYDNGYDVRSSPALKGVISLPAYFRQNGYYAASYGKVSHGWDLGALDDSSGHNRDPHPPGAPLNGWSKSKSGKVTETDWGPTHLAESDMNDTEKADQAIAQLRKQHDKPFFIACGLFHPHMPAYAPQKYFDLYPLDSIQLPPHTANDLDDVPAIGKDLADAKAFSPIIEHHQWKQAIQGYLASTSYADAQMGRVLDALNASPYKDNTIVVLISDNGFHIGEKQHWQKGTLWEEATHVLMMFRVPGLTKPGQVCERTVTLLDVFPTLVELAGLPKPSHLDGHSLVPLLKDSRAPWSFAALSAYQSNMSVRTDEYRLIRYKDGTTELYDETKDPHEWVNRANKPEYAEMQRTLAALLPAQEAMAPSVDEKGSSAGKREDKSAKKNNAAAKEE